MTLKRDPSAGQPDLVICDCRSVKVTPAGISVTHASRGLRVPTETAVDDAANAARKQVVLEDKSGWSWSWNDPITLHAVFDLFPFALLRRGSSTSKLM